MHDYISNRYNDSQKYLNIIKISNHRSKIFREKNQAFQESDLRMHSALSSCGACRRWVELCHWI